MDSFRSPGSRDLGSEEGSEAVEWRRWGQEALDEAQRLDKPLFLSIRHGGSYWSWAMEESFRDPRVAKLLNRDFVPVQEDQAEMTHLALASRALCQIMGGRDGWPLNVFMTFDRRPFFAGSYMPLESADSRMPGLLEVLLRVKWLWLMKRDTLERAASSYQSQLAQALQAAEGPLKDPDQLRAQALADLMESSDSQWGGFDQGPKFPQVPRLLLLARLSQDHRARDLLDRTLTAMAVGALQDHLEGGFHGYCLDRHWRVPCLGRRLLEQTAIAWAYLEGYRVFESPLYRRAALGCLRAVVDRLGRDGLLSCGEDLFSSGRDGADYYLWTRSEILEVLAGEGPWFCRTSGITDQGNFPEVSTGRPSGKNVLWMEPTEAPQLERLAASWAALAQRRRTRPNPPQEDRVLTGAVGLFAGVAARAARTLGEPQWAQESQRILEALLDQMAQGDQLFHCLSGGIRRGPANLEDYSALAWGCLELFQVTEVPRWLDLGAQWTQRAQEIFGSGGALVLMPSGTLELAPCWDGGDGLVPSGNAMAVQNLLALHRLTGQRHWLQKAREILESFGAALASYPSAYSGLVLGALDLAQQEG